MLSSSEKDTDTAVLISYSESEGLQVFMLESEGSQVGYEIAKELQGRSYVMMKRKLGDSQFHVSSQPKFLGHQNQAPLMKLSSNVYISYSNLEFHN